MKNKLLLYHCATQDTSTESIARRFNLLIDFCDMLGQDECDLYFDRKGSDKQLQEAIDECRKTNSYLLCYDIKSLHPNKGRAINIMEELKDQQIFVMFVDDESVMRSLGVQ